LSSGHFTALVWNNTTHVSFAYSENGKFIVANFSPAGNIVGQYGDNIGKQLEDPERRGNVVKRKKVGVKIDEHSNGVNIIADEWSEQIKEKIDTCSKQSIRDFVYN